MLKIKSIDKSASFLFLVAVLLLVSPFALKPIMTEVKMSYDWRAPFGRYQNLGEDCRVAFRPTIANANEQDMLLEGRRTAEAFQVPYRAEAKYTALPDGYWSYVSCKVTPRDIDKITSPLLYLGPLWGDTFIYLNGAEVRRFSTFATGTIHLTKSQATQPFNFEILSRNVGDGAGPMSLIPLVLLPSEAELRAVQRVLGYAYTEKTLAPLGVAGTLAILFLCCWMFGVRYRDVYWMIVACAAAAGTSGLQHYPDAEPPQWYNQFRLFVEMICWSSLWVAIYTFLRKPAKQWQLISFVLLVACAYQLQWLVPPDVRKEWIGAIDRHDGVWMGPVLMLLSYWAFKIDINIPNRRFLQRRILGIILLLFGIWVTWAGFYAFRIGFSTNNLTRTALIGLFGSFMMIDLVIFQRAYFEEKSLKEEEERRRTALEDRMELGFSIQRLLMPGSQVKEFGPFRIQVLYDCADKMAGDWFFWQENKTELRVLCGDVIGKGPQAAIAATSVLTMCHNFSPLESTLEGFLSRLNKTVSELFQSKPISTLGAVALGLNGTATVLNHGFAGWLHVGKHGVEMIMQRGASLGTKLDTKWPSKEVPLEIGDRLLIFSDGVLEGPRAIKRICDRLVGSGSNSLDDVIKLVLDVGKSSVVEDDRTLLIVERFR